MSLLQKKKILGDYQIGKTIGQGAFSKVKIGYHRETGAKVAIKIIDKKQVAEKARKAKQAQEEREKRKKEAEEKRQQQLRDFRAQEQRQWQQRQAQASGATQGSGLGTPDNSEAKSGSRQASFSNEVKDNEQGKAKAPERKDSQKKQDSEKRSSSATAPKESSDSSTTPGLVKALQVEVQLLMRLDHPNIIKLFQVMENEDECYVVMEYAPGGELIDYIASRKHLSEKEARRFFRQIISAMDHCHSANVVHRDLKLENLLLSADRNILISDFGLGRTFNSEVEDYMKTFCGTPNYAAVELISGIPYIGVKSDIWAMGVVLYIMMTGRPPFVGENISALYSKIRAVDYKCPDYFSIELRDILSRILVKDPMQRIDMSELRLHPWVMLEETAPPPIITPKIPEPAQLISSIHHEDDYIIYTFRQHSSMDAPDKKNRILAAKNTVASGATAAANLFKRRASMQPGGGISPDPMAVGGVTGIAEASKGRVQNGIAEEGDDEVAPLPSQPTPPRAQVRSGRRLSVQVALGGSSPGPASAPATMEKTVSDDSSPNTKRRAANITVTLQDGDTERLSPTAPPRKIRAPSAGPTGRRASLGLPTGGPVPRPQSNSNRPTMQVPQSANTFLRRASIATTEGQASTRRHNRYATESDAMAAAVAAHASRLANTSRASGSKSAASEDDWDLEMGAHNAQRGSFLGDLANPSMISSASPTDSDSPIDGPDTLTRIPSTNSRDSEVRAGSPLAVGGGVLSDDKTETGVEDDEATENLPEPTKKEIEEWHMLHKPPKTIRSIRYAFSSNTTSSMPPQAVFQEVHRVLLLLAQMYGEDRFVFERISDYYVLQCKLYDTGHKRVEVAFEIEVAKVWLLKLHGVRIKRLMGEPLLFKEFYTNIIAELHL